MIKKLSVLILSALFLVSLSGCGKKDQPAKSDQPKAEETKAEHPKAEETKSEHPK
jgi:PBP1b-binding outer membrane lipoprotein LpoB